MRVANITMAAMLLLSDFTSATYSVARTLGIEGSMGWQRDLQQEAKRIVEGEMGVERRQSSTNTIQSTPSSDRNSSIAQACMTVLKDITVISNDAGLSACYNVLTMDRTRKTFEADLRLYVAAPPKGAFTTVQPDNLMIVVKYPSSTKFVPMNSSSPQTGNVKRQSRADMSELQRYTLVGEIDPTIDLEKLSEPQLMSIMVPSVKITAVDEQTRTPIETNVEITDTAWFVIGDFQGRFQSDAANPEFQQKAIQESAVFVLPGTTFGIFPTGMVITLSWLLIFVIAYGFGTWKRYQHREFYRKRMHITRGGGLAAYEGRTGRKV